jgi:hypothetical protein
MIAPRRTVACWSLVAVLPFWSVYASHFLQGPLQPTGFLIMDAAYYGANGREIFERGNGLAYCNPYDPDPAAPVIYCHWLPWILGCGTKILGIDPGLVWMAVGAAGGLACAWFTFRLVEAVLPGVRGLPTCFLIAIWGGGLLIVASVITHAALGRPPLENLLLYDPFGGHWFLNWGRNLVLPVEAVYHALVAAAWLAVVRERPWPAVAAVAALAATHPFSGIQHILVLGAWFGFRALQGRRIEPAAVCLGLVTAAFVAYYFAYLPRWPQHRAIHERWSLAWNLGLTTILAAGLPVAALAAVRCWQDRGRWRPEMTFFLIAAGVSFALAKHELFLPPRQPLHFTRGYTWLPLCLLGLPVAQRMLARALALRGGRLLVAAALALAWLDNATWIAVQWGGSDRQGLRLAPALRDAFARLDAADERGVVVVVAPPGRKWPHANFLAGTYTGLTPLLGHLHLTPGFDALSQQAGDWLRSGTVFPALDRVTVAIVAPSFDRSKLPGGPGDWEQIHANDEVIVLRRRSPAPRPQAHSGRGS